MPGDNSQRESTNSETEFTLTNFGDYKFIEEVLEEAVPVRLVTLGVSAALYLLDFTWDSFQIYEKYENLQKNKGMCAVPYHAPRGLSLVAALAIFAAYGAFYILSWIANYCKKPIAKNLLKFYAGNYETENKPHASALPIVKKIKDDFSKIPFFTQAIATYYPLLLLVSIIWQEFFRPSDLNAFIKTFNFWIIVWPAIENTTQGVSTKPKEKFYPKIHPRLKEFGEKNDIIKQYVFDVGSFGYLINFLTTRKGGVFHLHFKDRKVYTGSNKSRFETIEGIVVQSFVVREIKRFFPNRFRMVDHLDENGIQLIVNTEYNENDFNLDLFNQAVKEANQNLRIRAKDLCNRNELRNFLVKFIAFNSISLVGTWRMINTDDDSENRKTFFVLNLTGQNEATRKKIKDFFYKDKKNY